MLSPVLVAVPLPAFSCGALSKLRRHAAEDHRYFFSYGASLGSYCFLGLKTYRTAALFIAAVVLVCCVVLPAGIVYVFSVGCRSASLKNLRSLH